MSKSAVAKEDAVVAARHCLGERPYSMLVLERVDHNGVPLYLVAGSADPARKAALALKTALERHGGRCFYCRATSDLTIDHAEPKALGGSDTLANLLIACRPCNQRKHHQPIEAFKPDAGKAWLQALLVQVQERLNRLDVRK